VQKSAQVVATLEESHADKLFMYILLNLSILAYGKQLRWLIEHPQRDVEEQ